MLRASGISIADIAKELGRNKGTISREVKRNRSSVYNCYCANQAQQRAKKRKQEAGKRERLKSPEIRRYVIRKLTQDWTPEQIAGKLPLDHLGLNISYEAIYQYIYDPKVGRHHPLPARNCLWPLEGHLSHPVTECLSCKISPVYEQFLLVKT